jgi:hypothetical protein
MRNASESLTGGPEDEPRSRLEPYRELILHWRDKAEPIAASVSYCTRSAISRLPSYEFVQRRRVDETYACVRGRWRYLYRASDSAGATIDFLLSSLRCADAAKRLFRKALSDQSHPEPTFYQHRFGPHLHLGDRIEKDDSPAFAAGTGPCRTCTTSSSTTNTPSNDE